MIRFDFHFKVRYKDIDQMGVMYYSRYFEYFEAARTDMMRALGLTYKALEAEGIMMPVVHSESDYFAGPGFDDHLTCITEVTEWPKSRMDIHYTIVHDDHPDVVINRGKTTHAFVKMDGKPTRMPDSLKQVLEEKWTPINE
ncbi:MAG: acyl-CoA thioesterase [Candidatus Marinimicrobia bacterium]|nr:acyl-CoA thioesterase [Candidatus Neomarinimicrobiota bacterium]MCF7922789.1 acyl-CoA thioesterase [Candidatus Neomarinimicrobiota bacterium]